GLSRPARGSGALPLAARGGRRYRLSSKAACRGALSRTGAQWQHIPAPEAIMFRKQALFALLLLATALPATTLAAENDQIVQRFSHGISNIPGKSLIAVEVNYAPGEKTPAHRHAASAFIMAYVVSSTNRSYTAGEPRSEERRVREERETRCLEYACS